MHDLDVVRAGIPAVDGCPALRRIKAFITTAGVCSVLEHVFRDRSGKPVDLSPTHPAVSESGSLVTPGIPSAVSDAANECPLPEGAHASGDTVLVRFREFVGCGSPDSGRIYFVEGTVRDAESGTVRARVPVEVAAQPGIYTASWAFVREGDTRLVNECLVSVESSLFGSGTDARDYTPGPPTINEIRVQLVDADAADNQLLNDVEFSDEQIGLAITKPVMQFNESPPPLHVHYNTTNFPWKNAWLDAIVGYLLQFAAHNYRRNRLNTSAGGMAIDDKNKEDEYLRASKMILAQWQDWMLAKKIEINTRGFVGTVGSSYGGGY